MGCLVHSGQAASLLAGDFETSATPAPATALSDATADQPLDASFPTKAAEQFELARKYLNGWEVARDEKKAFLLMKAAADQGYAEAFGGLGYFYGSGLVVDKNDTLSEEWFRKGALQGCTKAELNLGMMLYQAGQPQQKTEALNWIEAAAAQNLPQASYELGEIALTDHQPPEKAFVWFKESADLGYAEAQNKTGEMLEKGEGCQLNLTQAETYYRQAAEQGLAEAAAHLGKLLDPANPDPAKRVEALSWLLVASGKNEALAKDLLATVPYKENEESLELARQKALQFSLSSANR